ncbi:MAG: dipeptidase, partial [Lactobacillus iners]|nr:dipeptidase [Lactobacillus iners]
RYQYDQKLVNETQQNKVIDIVNQANKEMAQVAIKAFKKLISQLITLQTADSPLSFKIDPNL